MIVIGTRFGVYIMLYVFNEFHLTKNRDIQFIKPCRMPAEGHLVLTKEYANRLFSIGKIVQINLDNCSIQRMEKLSENSTLQDVEGVGLLPLVEILNNCHVALTAIGLNEMPDLHVKKARLAYERFCRKFWSTHKDDLDATYRHYNENSESKRISFEQLSNSKRVTYGASYVAMLHIQNIKLNYSYQAPEEQFKTYIYGISNLLGIISSFEVEIAKYAFWELNQREVNELLDSIRIRRKDIRENFAKRKTSTLKCKEFSFDAAMDIYWLSGANMSEDLNGSMIIKSKKYTLDIWVGTNDHKLYRICRDIHSVYFEGSRMKRLASTREDILKSLPYWKKVDRFAHEFLLQRRSLENVNMDDFLEKIDNAVSYLSGALDKSFLHNS